MDDGYSKWLIEGYFIKLYDPSSQLYNYYYVSQREKSEYVHTWSATIASDAESGPEELENLKPLALDRIYQTVFGIKTSCLIYVDFPQGTRRWGTDKKPKASSSNRYIGWIDHKMTPFDYPTFIGELFLTKGGSYEYPNLYAYNPSARTLKPQLHFIQNRCDLDVIEDAETIEKLDKKLIPYRFITLGGIPPTRSGAG